MTQAEASVFSSVAAAGLRPPGPPGMLAPVLAAGHMTRDLLAYLCDLERRYSGREMKPVGFRVLTQPMCLVVHPAQIKEVLTNNDLFARFHNPYFNAFRMALGRNIVTVPHDEHRPIRKRTAGYFSKSMLDHYGRVVVHVLDAVALPMCERKARTGESLEIFEEMLQIASRAVFMSFLGDGQDETPPELYHALNEIFDFVRCNVFKLWLPPLWVPTETNRRLRRNLERVHGYLRARLQSDRDKDSMLGDIIRTYTDPTGRIHAENVLGETVGNLVGGSETTIILMAWVLYYIILHPQAEQKLLAEIDQVLGERPPSVDDFRAMPYLLCVVNETLRLRSPAYLSMRIAERHAQLDGYAIEKGAMICVSQHITHRHPLVWKNPEQFNPDRFASSSEEAPARRKSEMPFFPFGGGSLSCLGMNFAVNEAALMVAMLLRRFRFSPADPESFASVGIDARLTLRPDRPMRVRVSVRERPVSCDRASTSS